jgi:hypothetical protein
VAALYASRTDPETRSTALGLHQRHDPAAESAAGHAGAVDPGLAADDLGERVDLGA